MGHAVEERLERLERLVLHEIRNRGEGVPVGKGPEAAARRESVAERRRGDLEGLVETVARQAPPSEAS